MDADIARLRYQEEPSERWRGDMVTHLPGHSPHWAWGVEWIWVGGYSAAATTILLLNVILFISIIRQVLTNKIITPPSTLPPSFLPFF